MSGWSICALAMRERGAEPDLLDRLAADPRLPLDRSALDEALADKAAFIGSAGDQVDEVVAAVKAAGLVDTLSGPGPFTVFAPTNEAFDALPAGTVETLLKPENKDQLVKILTCHVVAADAMSDAIKKMVMDDGGAHTVMTVGGCELTVKTDGDKIMITDETGATAHVTIADVKQSNGVIHVIDKVLLPAMG